MTAPGLSLADLVAAYLKQASEVLATHRHERLVRELGAGGFALFGEIARMHQPDQAAGLADYLISPATDQTRWCAGHAQDHFPCHFLVFLAERLHQLLTEAAGKSGGRR